MEIEFILAAPPGVDIARFDAIEPLGQAYAGNPVQHIAAPEATSGYWFARFGIPCQGDWPVAPFRLSAAAAGNDYWLCADPIHLQLDGNRLLLDPQSLDDLSDSEAGSLIAVLNAHFAADGMQLHAVSPTQWVLRVPRALDMVAPAPGLASGMAAASALPQGADAAWARRLSSEAQMLLHQAAVNLDRESQRRWPANSLWLWGGGMRPAAGVAPAPQQLITLSSQTHVRELCRASNGEAADLPETWSQASDLLNSMHGDKALIDLTDIARKPAWEAILQSHWLGPAALAAKKQNLTFWAVFLTSHESLRVRLYRRDLFHFYRRKSLAQHVDKSQNPRNR